VPLLIVVTYRERESRGTRRLRGPVRGSSSACRSAASIARRSRRSSNAPRPARRPRSSSTASLELTEGNPFFVEEILRGLGDDGPTGAAARVPLPDSLRATIRRRLDPLP
jgi:hypothetical protein